MDVNLIVDDEYVEDVGRACKRHGQELEEVMTQYLRILRETKEQALVKGRTSDTLGTYIQCVSLLSNRLTLISENAERNCKKYVQDINKADAYLF